MTKFFINNQVIYKTKIDNKIIGITQVNNTRFLISINYTNKQVKSFECNLLDDNNINVLANVFTTRQVKIFNNIMDKIRGIKKHTLKLYYNSKGANYFIYNNTRYYLNELMYDTYNRYVTINTTNSSTTCLYDIDIIYGINEYITFKSKTIIFD